MLLAGCLWHKGAYNRTFPCMEANYPDDIKNQRGASKIPPNGGMPELVLYGIRLLAKQFLGTVLDMEVAQSASDRRTSRRPTWWFPCWRFSSAAVRHQCSQSWPDFTRLINIKTNTTRLEIIKKIRLKFDTKIPS